MLEVLSTFVNQKNCTVLPFVLPSGIYRLEWEAFSPVNLSKRRTNPCKSLAQRPSGWSTTDPIEGPCIKLQGVFDLPRTSSGFESLAARRRMRVGLTAFGSRDNTLKSYQAALASFLSEFTGRQLGEITNEEILSFLNRVTEGRKPQTRRIRYAHLSAFFNFIRNNLDQEFRNPCDTPAMKRLFRNRAPSR